MADLDIERVGVDAQAPSAEYLEGVEGVAPTAYREEMDCTDSGVHFRCNHCHRVVDSGPCPEHAPVDVPGLRRVECETGEHVLWAVDRDDYGHGCPLCWVAQLQAEVDHLTRCRHWPWRRWRATRWVLRWLPVAQCWQSGNGHRGCTTMRWWWGKYRDSRLGHLLRYRHWPTGPAGIADLCGRCLPCSDCGSTEGVATHHCPVARSAEAVTR